MKRALLSSSGGPCLSRADGGRPEPATVAHGGHDSDAGYDSRRETVPSPTPVPTEILPIPSPTPVTQEADERDF